MLAQYDKGRGAGKKMIKKFGLVSCIERYPHYISACAHTGKMSMSIECIGVVDEMILSLPILFTNELIIKIIKNRILLHLPHLDNKNVLDGCYILKNVEICKNEKRLKFINLIENIFTISDTKKQKDTKTIKHI
jgi:hypothetical protein